MSVSWHTKGVVIMQKSGINIDAFEPNNSKKSNLKNTIKLIADLGFGAIFNDASFEKPPTEVAEYCARYGLLYQFVHAPFRGTNNIWLDKTAGDEMYSKIITSVNEASDAGVPVAVVHISSTYTPPPISEVGANRFKKIVEHAHNKNVKIAFENLRVPGYLEWAMNTFNDASNVGFCWDTGHENCFTEGVDFMSLYGDKLLCTHIHDNHCEKSGDLHLIPFDGKIDFAKVASQLKKSGYRGPLMLEVFSKNEIYRNVSELEFFQKAHNSITKIQKLINN